VQYPLLLITLTLLLCFTFPSLGQSSGYPARSSLPRVITPTASAYPSQTRRYPWKQNITATVFWIGEKPSGRNLTPNHASSWDTRWQENYGGYDDPDTTARIQYRPKAFMPKLNPFYVALPYNDCLNYKTHCPHAKRVIPWWLQRADKRPGKSACKGRWLQIVYGKKVCYAQWEDCGPFTTDDWPYVFGNQRPKNTANKAAGLDVSPAVRDYLGMPSMAKVHWRFIEFSNIPKGPWSQYGGNNPFLNKDLDPTLKARQAHLEYLRKLRDEAYARKKDWR
jgi:hypothetical protein